jgi:hypothetical protein
MKGFSVQLFDLSIEYSERKIAPGNIFLALSKNIKYILVSNI